MTAQKRVDEGRLIDAYRSGLTTREIAQELGIAHGTIYKVLNRAGEPLRGSPPLTPTEEGRILDAYQSGVLLEDIADRFGVSRRTVHNVLNRKDEPRRPLGPRLIDFSDTELRRIGNLRGDGWSIGEIMTEMRCGLDRLTRAFDQLGLSRDRGVPRNAKPSVRTSGGYAVVRLSPDDPMAPMGYRNGYVMEHRLVMARKLGRALESHETVHHINGDRLDNRPENLQLRNGHHGKGVPLRCRTCGSHDIETYELEDARMEMT